MHLYNFVMSIIQINKKKVPSNGRINQSTELIATEGEPITAAVL